MSMLPADILINEIIPRLDQASLRAINLTCKLCAKHASQYVEHVFLISLTFEDWDTRNYHISLSARDATEALRRFLTLPNTAHRKRVYALVSKLIHESRRFLDSANKVARDFSSYHKSTKHNIQLMDLYVTRHLVGLVSELEHEDYVDLITIELFELNTIYQA